MSIENLINTLHDGKDAEAKEVFNSVMQSKINSALDTAKINIASSIGSEEVASEVSDEEV